jgi:hypothetical protein
MQVASVYLQPGQRRRRPRRPTALGPELAVTSKGLQQSVCGGRRPDGPVTWSGSVTCLLVGNARKFVERALELRVSQAALVDSAVLRSCLYVSFTR